MKNFFTILSCLVLLYFVGCSSDTCKTLSESEINELLAKVKAAPLEDVAENEVAVLETNYGTMVIKFFPDVAPEHSKAFKRLVKTGYYDCTHFHRIVQDFVIQGGDILTRDDDPDNDGSGGPGYTLPAEFSDIPHDKGIVSMARKSDINSAGSQFFICLSRSGTRALDGQYTVFGKLVEGMDVLDKIAAVKTVPQRGSGELSRPAEPVFIKKAYMKTM
jgi:cyclophilin family peptidyl-prolyl cis-trans isomerase